MDLFYFHFISHFHFHFYLFFTFGLRIRNQCDITCDCHKSQLHNHISQKNVKGSKMIISYCISIACSIYIPLK